MKLFNKQEIHKRGAFSDEHGTPYNVKATIRFDDRCNNGHNTFSITGDVWAMQDRHDHSFGCVHNEIAKAIPELQPYLKYHLCSTDGPLHYVANTMYRALSHGPEKGWLYRKEENVAGVTIRKSCVKYCAIKEAEKVLSGDSERFLFVLDEKTAKEANLDHARSSAIWPEATDEELMQDPEELKKALEDRLPALMKEFKAAVLSLGLEYGDEVQ
jgi:hypothetical protein